jgi:hypothetical protein
MRSATPVQDVGAHSCSQTFPGAEAEREVPEVVEVEEARDQRNVRRTGTHIHSPPPEAPVLVAPVAPVPRWSSMAMPLSASARGVNVRSNAPGQYLVVVVGS